MIRREEMDGPPYPWTREHPAIDIVGFDGVSDNGQEIYNFFKQEGITNVALMGVHTNICILNRGFRHPADDAGSGSRSCWSAT